MNWTQLITSEMEATYAVTDNLMAMLKDEDLGWKPWRSLKVFIPLSPGRNQYFQTAVVSRYTAFPLLSKSKKTELRFPLTWTEPRYS